MGDCCYMELYVPNEDVEKFCNNSDGLCELRDFEPRSDLYDFRRVCIEEVNYGGDRYLEAAAKAGCLAFGYHSSGSEYPANSIFMADGKLWLLPIEDWVPFVHLILVEQADGSLKYIPNEDAVARANEFLKVREETMAKAGFFSPYSEHIFGF